ncbi:hypothetical protein COLO4_03533 [Corchorus olitorius]|uniref:Uncharacterized protein n=1 Tax=Corchorus olitorius TaxID=93759 RepID=A0A1R3KY18_9ROSI|nr:hypothetical protein COLO4_03533 [Corchorus olitorius]
MANGQWGALLKLERKKWIWRRGTEEVAQWLHT